MQRIGGTALILVGAGVMGSLSSLFYAPIPDVSAILVALGMPGILLGALVGILCIGSGSIMLIASLGSPRPPMAGGAKPALSKPARTSAQAGRPRRWG
jgi:hypothetical protein